MQSTRNHVNFIRNRNKIKPWRLIQPGFADDWRTLSVWSWWNKWLIHCYCSTQYECCTLRAVRKKKQSRLVSQGKEGIWTGCFGRKINDELKITFWAKFWDFNYFNYWIKNLFLAVESWSTDKLPVCRKAKGVGLIGQSSSSCRKIKQIKLVRDDLDCPRKLNI